MTPAGRARADDAPDTARRPHPITQLLGRDNTLVVHVPVVRAVGSIEAALILEQLVFHQERSKDPDGWVARSRDEWIQELPISMRQLRQGVEHLTEMGLVETKKRRAYRSENLAPVLHYRADLSVLVELLTGDSGKSDLHTVCKSDLHDAYKSREVSKSDLHTPSKSKELRNLESKNREEDLLPPPPTPSEQAATPARTGGGGGAGRVSRLEATTERLARLVASRQGSEKTSPPPSGAQAPPAAPDASRVSDGSDGPDLRDLPPAAAAELPDGVPDALPPGRSGQLALALAARPPDLPLPSPPSPRPPAGSGRRPLEGQGIDRELAARLHELLASRTAKVQDPRSFEVYLDSRERWFARHPPAFIRAVLDAAEEGRGVTHNKRAAAARWLENPAQAPAQLKAAAGVRPARSRADERMLESYQRTLAAVGGIS